METSLADRIIWGIRKSIWGSSMSEKAFNWKVLDMRNILHKSSFLGAVNYETAYLIANLFYPSIDSYKNRLEMAEDITKLKI